MRSKINSLKKHLNSILAIVSIFTFGLIFFSPSWSNPFVFDDIIKIQENSDLKSGINIWETLIYPYQKDGSNLRNDPSRPVVSIIYRFCFHLANGQPWPFHFVNTMIHCFNAILVFLLTGLIARRLFLNTSLKPGLASAFLFLLLPINANTVLYAYALSDILMTFFVLTALYLLSKNTKISRLNFSISIFLFLCALLSKQSAVIFPVLLVLTDLFLGNEITKRRFHYLILLSIPFFYILIRYNVLGGIGDLEANGQTFSQIDYLFVQGIMILKYLKLALFPYGFAIDHTLLPQDFVTFEKLSAWILIFGLFVVALFYINSKKNHISVRLASWFWIFFIVALLPVSSFLPTVDLFVERRAYLPTIAIVCMIGLLLPLGTNIGSKIFTKVLWISFLAAVFILIAVTSWNRSILFSSPQNLWEESLTLYPKSKRIRVNLGVADMISERFNEAKSLFESVTNDYPNDAFAYSKLALIYHNNHFKGYNPNSALAYYKKALELSPNDVVTLYNLGSLMMDNGDLEKAESFFRQALLISPRFAYAKSGLGNSLIKKGHIQEGVFYLQEALKLDPQTPGAREQLLFLKK
jgi:Flp pilus assembly protein TadD